MKFYKKITFDWSETSISILGAGISGIAAATLGRYIGANIFISDISNNPSNIKQMKEFDHEFGIHSEKILDSDLIIISPGIPDTIPIIKKCQDKDIPLISEIEFGSWLTKSPIMALTGSNGKTTTINLLHNICICAGINSFLGGNVGIPFSENVLLELKMNIPDAVHVLELSSFQLEHIQSFSPKIAGLLNISNDHMDRYKNIIDYSKKKLNIIKNMTDSGKIIYNGDDPFLNDELDKHARSRPFSTDSKIKSHFKLNATKIYSGTFNNPKILFKLDKTRLKGNHNIQNILAAATMANAFDIPDIAIKDAITNFKPIPHRLEWVGSINSIDYFNDSKATNIAATHAAIKSFDNNLILILGGQDKGDTNFYNMISTIKNRIKLIIAYGEAGIAIKEQLNNEIQIVYKHHFSASIIEAYKNATQGDTILLSPACSSFDQFTNFEERGDAFKKIFNQLEMNL